MPLSANESSASGKSSEISKKRERGNLLKTSISFHQKLNSVFKKIVLGH